MRLKTFLQRYTIESTAKKQTTIMDVLFQNPDEDGRTWQYPLPDRYKDDLYLAGSTLTTLEGCPKSVERNFHVASTWIKSLEHGPKYVGGDFNASNTPLASLKYGPEVVEGDYSCHTCELRNLIGAPGSVFGDFNCSNNGKLISLEGAPAHVGGDFICTHTKISTLSGISKEIEGDLNVSNNPITSFEGVEDLFEHLGGMFGARHIQLKSHVLGLLLIPCVESFDLDSAMVTNILNAHIGDIYGAQTKLIEAGYEELAQL